jgi:hypothetical protein
MIVTPRRADCTASSCGASSAGRIAPISLFVRGLALAHLDATLGRRTEAARFLRDDVERAFAAKGIPVESVRAEPCNKIDTPRTDG